MNTPPGTDNEAPTQRAVSDTTGEVASDNTANTPGQPEPDPESFAEITQGSILVKVAAAMLITLAAFALLLALTS